ncbi:ComF family protein [Thalassobacillus sp. CUG 92003]|uniref:ComF family protein n=1 Tax=Thalassobacillus sp. CUG 92003 TaxID=2736641 RepID=UPI0015E74D43|nr:ComF family protein [Thalassobacillus sp. CUG 92003]
MDCNATCSDCQKWEQSDKWQGVLKRNQSLYHYHEGIQEVITQWKYRGDYVLVKLFQSDIERIVKDRRKQWPTAVVPIPLSSERLVERGFNQAEAIARLMTRKPVHLLERLDSEKQSKKTRYERLNRINPFRSKTSVPPHVLLVDDIYTTGATLRYAAKALQDAGCLHIESFTLIRG